MIIKFDLIQLFWFIVYYKSLKMNYENSNKFFSKKNADNLKS